MKQIVIDIKAKNPVLKDLAVNPHFNKLRSIKRKKGKGSYSRKGRSVGR
jgi:stalled ribosome alternative rescue factor ArfA